MKREIKFRVKRKFYDLYDKYIETKWEYFTIVDGVPYASECLMETVGQFTGSKDKNGVEIYEGDRVEFIFYDYETRTHNLSGVIKYKNCSFYIESDYGVSYYSWIDYHTFEVIGNIHEEVAK